jgi:hypothetical protein
MSCSLDCNPRFKFTFFNVFIDNSFVANGRVPCWFLYVVTKAIFFVGPITLFITIVNHRHIKITFSAILYAIKPSSRPVTIPGKMAVIKQFLNSGILRIFRLFFYFNDLSIFIYSHIGKPLSLGINAETKSRKVLIGLMFIYNLFILIGRNLQSFSS